MAVLTAAFNPAGATNGATLATSDTGDLTAFNSISGTPKYDNTHTLFGKSLSCMMNLSASQGFWKWTVGNYGAPTEDYGRFYIYFASLPSSQSMLLQVNTAGGFGVYLNSTNKLMIFDVGSGGKATATNALSTGTWYRVEYHYQTGATTPTVSYYDQDSTTPTETLTATSWTVTGFNDIVVGTGDANHTMQYWLAQVAVKGTAAIGPYPVNTVAPAVSGSTTVGSTLTCDGGTWNGTFTIGYQWTADGSNIAAATGSTYVTQAGDAGKAIGCTVTATGQQATNESASQASGNTVTVASGGATSGSASVGVNFPTAFIINP